MRLRRLFPVLLVSATALALTGCAAGAPEADSSASPSASTALTLCESATPTGATSDAVKVTGDFGVAPTITIGADAAEMTTVERTVAVTGDGAELQDGDFVSYALSVYDASTGALAQSQGYGDEAIQPMAVSVATNASTGVASVFGCATVGSRIVVAQPASEAGPAAFYVFDVLGTTPEAKWCAIDDTKATLPEVTFAESGEPTITIPAGATPPAGVHVEVLKQGDGAEVISGETVTVEYTGIRWSNGETFDSSWTSEDPISFPTTGVVQGFKRALEGQKVGTTVLVTMSPECGYGMGTLDNTGSSLVGETLAFVVDIEKSEATKPATN